MGEFPPTDEPVGCGDCESLMPPSVNYSGVDRDGYSVAGSVPSFLPGLYFGEIPMHVGMGFVEIDFCGSPANLATVATNFCGEALVYGVGCDSFGGWLDGFCSFFVSV